jgi:hypothetical protein
MTDTWRGRLRGIGIAAAAIVVAGVAGYGVKAMMGHGSVPKPQRLQTITRVTLPPPPPPPPPQATPPKEEIKQSLEQPKVLEPKPARKAPDPAKAPAPPGNPLTAEAGNGPSAYGLGVGSGGGDTIGGGGGGGGDAKLVFAAYSQSVAEQIAQALKHDERTRSSRYAITVDVWLTPTGQVSRTSIVESSGSKETDQVVIEVISGQSYGHGPQGMPPRIRFRSSARPA